MTSLIHLFSELKDINVIDKTISYSQYTPLDLTEANLELNHFNLSNAIEFEAYIEMLLDKNNASVAYGGYNEVRTIYKRSEAFYNNNTEERNIHIGLDLWIKAGTNVLAALDGKVHSFYNNDIIGDYGPTIILEHIIENHHFYTLYGHLSLESITTLKTGDFFVKGQKIATLGDATVNGDFAPHLHFQIIKELDGNFGDYPGVCSKNNLEYYLENCPDPNFLLKIK